MYVKYLLKVIFTYILESGDLVAFKGSKGEFDVNFTSGLPNLLNFIDFNLSFISKPLLTPKYWLINF